MPTCPGCRRRVAHGDLPAHARYCRRLWTGRSERGTGWDDHLADALGGLDDRAADAATVADLEARVERLEARDDGDE